MLFPALAVSFLGYFGYHAFHGSYGIVAKSRLEHDVQVLREQRDAIRADRQRFEHRIKLLRSGSLDPDMIDERARKTLNLMHPDEISIPLPRQIGQKG